MLSLRTQDKRRGTANGGEMHLLYVKASASAVDGGVVQQLEQMDGGAKITCVTGTENARAVMEKSRAGGDQYFAVLVSPELSDADTIHLVGVSREESVPVPVVPVVADAHRGFSALIAGVDAVMLLMDGVLVKPEETLRGIRETGAPAAPEAKTHTPAPTVLSAGRKVLAELGKLQSYFSSGGDDMPPDATAREEFSSDDRLRLKARLDQALSDRVRIETGNTPPEGIALGGLNLNSVPPAVGQESAGDRRRSGKGGSDASSEVGRAAAEASAARSALRQALDEHHGEHARWQTTRKELETRVSELEAALNSKAEIDGALTAARRDFAAAAEMHAHDRATWEASRAALEARVRELEVALAPAAELTVALTAARRDLEAVAEAQARERAAWDASRQKLEAALEARAEDLVGTARANMDLEAALGAARAELAEAAERLSRERSAWDAARQALEARVKDHDATVAARAALEIELGEAQVALEEVGRTQAARRAQWEAERKKLEAKVAAGVAEVQSAARAQTAIESTLDSTRAELRQVMAAHAAERDSWQSARRELEDRIRQLEADEQERKGLEAAIVAAQAERAEAVAAQRVLGGQLEEARTRVQRLAQDALSLREQLESA